MTARQVRAHTYALMCSAGWEACDVRFKRGAASAEYAEVQARLQAWKAWWLEALAADRAEEEAT